jgi:hypothetical protein
MYFSCDKDPNETVYSPKLIVEGKLQEVQCYCVLELFAALRTISMVTEPEDLVSVISKPAFRHHPEICRFNFHL